MFKKLLTQLQLLAVLTWTIPQGALDGFRIYRADSISAPFSLVGTVGAAVSTFTDSAGAPGHCWRVTAFKGSEESQPSNNGCLLIVIPTAPALAVKP